MSNQIETVLNEAGSKSNVYSLRRTFPAYLTLILGIAISLLVWRLVDGQVKSERSAQFEKATSSVLTRLNQGYREHEQVLTSIKGLYQSSVQVVRDQFELYGSIPTRTYSSLLSVSYVPYVPEKMRETFIFYAMSEGYYDYKITPEGRRELYLPVEYTVPMSSNAHRVGVDLAVDSAASRAISKSRGLMQGISSEIVATPFYSVRPDTSGFLLMFSVKKKVENLLGASLTGGSIEGSVILEIDAEKYFNYALGNGEASDSTIIFECIDTNAAARRVVYASKNFESAGQYNAVLEERTFVQVADRTLEVHFKTVPGFGGSFQTSLPLLSLIIALVLSFAAFGFVLSITTSRARAIDLADRLTASQRRIIDASQDIIAVFDMSGTWKTVSPAASKILGYAYAELIGKKVTDLASETKDADRLRQLWASAPDEQGVHLEMQARTKSGQIVWLGWQFTVSKSDQLIYATGRDITLDKTAQEEIRLRSKQVELAEQSALEANDFKSRFMRDLSHNLRNNLTGSIGFLQLVTDGLYDSDQEMRQFVADAELSSEQLFSIVTDIVDVAGDQGALAADSMHRVGLKGSVESVATKVSKAHSVSAFSFEHTEDAKDTQILADPTLLEQALSRLLGALVSGGVANPIVRTRQNVYEQVAEIEVQVNASDKVVDMISLYKEHNRSIATVLSQDQDDILFNLALATVIVKRMRGSLMIDTLGKGEESIALLTLPLGMVSKRQML